MAWSAFKWINDLIRPVGPYVLFRIFFVLAVADAVITWIAVTAVKLLLRLSSSFSTSQLHYYGERTKGE